MLLQNTYTKKSTTKSWKLSLNSRIIFSYKTNVVVNEAHTVIFLLLMSHNL